MKFTVDSQAMKDVYIGTIEIAKTNQDIVVLDQT